MINPLKITQEQFDRRWDEMPETLRELLYSPEHTEIIQHICEKNHLNEDKTGTVLGLVGGVIMGFIHIQDLDHQIATRIDLNTEMSGSIASDIRERVLGRFEGDISKVFQPSLPSEREERAGSSDIKVIGRDFSNKEIAIPVIPEDTDEKRPAPPSGAPFILHEEKKPETASGEKTSLFKSFSVPLGFFKPKTKSAVSGPSNIPVTAKVEAPEKSNKRVVNYSELRTSLSPFEGEQNFLNVGKSEPIRPAVIPPSPVPEPKKDVFTPAKTDAPPKSFEPIPMVASSNTTPTPKKKETEILGTIKRTEPKIEGNIIDLKS